MKTFTFYSTPGHGYLRVPTSLIIKMGLTDRISHYSGMGLTSIYLEEDRDASLFIEKLKEAGIKFRTQTRHVKSCTSHNYNPQLVNIQAGDIYLDRTGQKFTVTGKIKGFLVVSTISGGFRIRNRDIYKIFTKKYNQK